MGKRRRQIAAAPLNLILEANNKPTGDQLVQERLEAEQQRIKEKQSAYAAVSSGRLRNRRNMEKMYEKQGLVAPWLESESGQ